VLLYNAHRNLKLGDRPQYGKEYGPVPAPTFDIWKNAWTSALRMDRPTVTRFLVACYEGCHEDAVGQSISCRRPIMCPVGWHLPDIVS
jgi:hypothetical protein